MLVSFEFDIMLDIYFKNKINNISHEEDIMLGIYFE